jgi:hypothetical protein
MFIAGPTNYLQMSACRHLNFLFPQSGRTKRINTWWPFWQVSVLSQVFCNIHIISSRKTHWTRKQKSNKTGNYYLCLCALLLQVSVKRSSEIQYGVIYPKTCKNAGLHSGHLNFILVALFTAKPPPPNHNQFLLSVLCQVCLVGWSMGLVACCVVITVWCTLPTSYIRSLTIMLVEQFLTTRCNTLMLVNSRTYVMWSDLSI